MSGIKLFITGDFCMNNRASKSLDLTSIIELTEFVESDYRLTNLEAPITTNLLKELKTGPSLKNPLESIDVLKSSKFNLLCLANNHIMDYGSKGLVDTLEICKKNNINYIGAGCNKKIASDPFVIEKGGYKLAIINIAENEFGEASEERPGFYAYDPIDAFYLINYWKSKVDDIVIIFHGGHEHYRLPSPKVQKRYRFLIDSGATAVIAHHTHCFSGYENYNEGIIFYSLGNFIFDNPHKRDDNWNYGFALSIVFDLESKISFKIIPYEQFNHTPGIEIMEGENNDNFFKEIYKLNRIISSPILLRKEWNNFYLSNKNKYLTYVEVPNFRYLRGARFYRLIPSFISKKHKAIILNLLRCPSHKEIFSESIRENIS